MKYDNLQVGQKIAFNTSNRGHAWGFEFDTVARVTKTLVELTNGRKFKKDYGQEVKSKVCNYPQSVLYNLECAEKQIASDELMKKKQQAVADLKAAIDSRRSYDGNYHFDENCLELMKQLETAIAQRTE